MQVYSAPDYLEIVLFEPEAALLEDIFEQIISNYQTRPEDLEGTVRGVWYSGEGFHSAQMDSDDVAFWLDDLYSFRGENSKKCERWIEEIQTEDYPMLWRVSHEDVDTLLTVINDHRLYCAAQHSIGDQEMEMPLEEIDDISVKQALIEIHFLAWLMELILNAQATGQDNLDLDFLNEDLEDFEGYDDSDEDGPFKEGD